MSDFVFPGEGYLDGVLDVIESKAWSKMGDGIKREMGGG